MENIDFSKLSDIVQKTIDANKNLVKKDNNYWYKLNYPTYDSKEIISAIQSLLNYETTMGKKVLKFEEKFSNYIENKYSIFVNSGSSADLLAIKSIINSKEFNLKQGDKVLVPAITWPTQVWSIKQAGLEPILFDCSIDNFNPDISTVPENLLKEAKGVFITHILGTCCDMDELLNYCEKYQLVLLEDSCEALGAKFKKKTLGTFGSIGTYSSFFSHHIMTMEGGIVTTNSESLLDQLKLLRSHGWSRSINEKNYEKYLHEHNLSPEDYKSMDKRYLFINEGFNFRPTEINAAFGIEQLNKIDNFNKTRKNISNIFYENINKSKNFKGPKIVKGCEPNFMGLMVSIKTKVKKSSYVLNLLDKKGIEARPLIAGNLLKHPAAKINNIKKHIKKLVGADFHNDYSFYIGISPMHDESQINKLISHINEIDYIISNEK